MTDFRRGSKCLECGRAIGSRYDHAEWCPEHPQNRKLVPDGGIADSYQLPDGEECEPWRCGGCGCVFSVPSGIVPEPWKCPYCGEKSIRRLPSDGNELVAAEVGEDRYQDTADDAGGSP